MVNRRGRPAATGLNGRDARPAPWWTPNPDAARAAE